MRLADGISSPTPTPTRTTSTTSPSSPSLPQPSAHVVLFLIDGIGDVPCRAFENPRNQQQRGTDREEEAAADEKDKSTNASKNRDLTPLQAAAPLEALDAVASCGLLGLLDPVEPGKACGSDTAHLSLLGYDPRTYYRGRGAFESLGAGLSMDPGDIAFKCNFATVAEEEEEEEEEEGEGSNKKSVGNFDPVDLAPTPLVVSRRADRSFEREGPVLCRALDGLRLPNFQGVTVRVKYATEHRAGVVLSAKRGDEERESSAAADGGGRRGRGRRRPLLPPHFELSDAVSGTDPLRDSLPLLRCRSLLAPDGSESESEGAEGEGKGKEEDNDDDSDADAETNARITADIVNELSDEIRKVLRRHPINGERRRQGKPVANALLLRGCGARAPLPDFARKFGFLSCFDDDGDGDGDDSGSGSGGDSGKSVSGSGGALAVAPTKIIAGLASCAGFRVLEVRGATGDYRTSLRAKVEAVASAIEAADEERWRRRRTTRASSEEEGVGGGNGTNGASPPPPPPPPPPKKKPSFVLLHFKAVDDAGHDRLPFKKASWLRAADEAVAVLAGRLGGRRSRDDDDDDDESSPCRPRRQSLPPSSVVIAVTGDHSTPVEFGDHSCEPVPFAAAPLDAVARVLFSSKGKKNPGEERVGGVGGGGDIVAPSEDEMRRHVFSSSASSSSSFSSSSSKEKKNNVTFDETSASQGSLGRFPGSEVMPLLVRLSAAL